MSTKYRTIGLVSLLLASLACTSANETALTDRAQGFGDLLVEIRGLPEDDAFEALESYIEPGEDQEDQIWEYYDDFSAASEKWRVMGHSIIKIRIHDDQERAIVTYQTIMRGERGDLPVDQETYWLRVNDAWYRTLDDSKKSLG